MLQSNTTDDVMFCVNTKGKEHKIHITEGKSIDKIQDILTEKLKRIQYHHELLQDDNYMKHCINALIPYCFNHKATKQYQLIFVNNDRTLSISVHRF